MFEAAAPHKRWALPTLALLLVGSLLFGHLPPAAGVDGVVDHPARYSACVDAAVTPAGFVDMAGNFAEEAANCLAHYGITFGTGAGRFSPRDIIPRWQMALFLQRATHPAGLVLPKPTDQGFTDLGTYATHIQAGINQMAQLGIMPGLTDKTYGPAEPVTRQSMAMLLSRFLEAAPIGPGGTAIRDVRPDDSNFKDLDQVPFVTNRAIRRLYELGVTQGTTANAFSPEAWVTRGQMAVFITRMLAHTNARPAGLSVQTTDEKVFKGSSAEISITLRDGTHGAFANQGVDLFTTETQDKAFDKEGRCTSEAIPAAGATECVIDRRDPTTDISGNLTADVEVGESAIVRIWVWTGNLSAEFDLNRTRFVAVDVATRSTPAALLVTDDLPDSAVRVPFGRAVTFTFQVVDDDGNPVPWQGASFVVEVQESRDGGKRIETTTLTKQTGIDGSAQATFLNIDPSEERGDVAFLDLDVMPGGGLGVTDETAVGIVDDDGTRDDPTLQWSDERPEPTTLTLSALQEYVVASSAGSGAAATVTALLSDQYGGPVRGEQVVFSSNDSRGVPNGIRRTTNASGVAALNYQRDSNESFAERVTGSFDRITSTTRQFWVTRIQGPANGSGTVRVVDTDEDTAIIVATNDILLVEYDSNDQFTINKKAVSYSDFEDDLTVRDTLEYRIMGAGSGIVNGYILTNR